MKKYYIILKDGSPPAITESWKAAEYWKRQGCRIIEYIDTGKSQ